MAVFISTSATKRIPFCFKHLKLEFLEELWEDFFFIHSVCTSFSCQSLVWSLIHVWSPPSSGPVTPPPRRPPPSPRTHKTHSPVPHLFCVWLHGLIFHFCTMFVVSSNTGDIAFVPPFSLSLFLFMASLCSVLSLCRGGPLSDGRGAQTDPDPAGGDGECACGCAAVVATIFERSEIAGQTVWSLCGCFLISNEASLLNPYC